MTRAHTVLWRRIDRPGHESARLTFHDSLWSLSGTAVFAEREQACRLEYLVVCDAQWRTLSARVAGWLGAAAVEIQVSADAEGRWLLNGEEVPGVAACTDVDFQFSPSTNLLPIRRLDLRVGERRCVRAAWLRFPGFTLEPLEQTYHRIGESTYRYESAGGSFRAEIEVDAAGFVTSYPNLWRLEEPAPPSD